MLDVSAWIFCTREERSAHLRLDEPCCERGGNSTNHKGVLAQFLDSTIPATTSSGRILLCHACNNAKCSNPKYLYWGTDSENCSDAKSNGSWKSGWEKMIDKHGLEEARRIQSRKKLGNKNARP